MGIKNLSNRSLGDNRIIESKSSLDAGLVFPCPPAWWVHPLSGFTLGGGNEVSQWNDASGNGNHLVQATGVLQPIWTANELNGYAGVVFTAHQLTTAASVPETAGSFTLFVVGRFGNVNWSNIFVMDAWNTGGWLARSDGTSMPANALNVYFANSSHNSPILVTEDVYNIYVVTFTSGGALKAFVRDYTVITTTSAAISAQTIGIGQATYKFTGAVVEEIFFPRVFTQKEIQLVLNQLRRKYNIYQ